MITVVFAEETGSIPGVPGKDYPIYSRPPKTNFACVKGHSGYYADVSTRCQVSVVLLALSILYAYVARGFFKYRAPLLSCS